MPMTRGELLDAVIDDACTEIPMAYPRPDQRDKRDGGIAGAQSCRGMEDAALLTHLDAATKRSRDAMARRATDYWWHRMFEIQVEWVLNVLSAAAWAHGMPPAMTPTARGLAKAAEVLGVASPDDAGEYRVTALQ